MFIKYDCIDGGLGQTWPVRGKEGLMKWYKSMLYKKKVKNPKSKSD